jgi:glycosyltransferase involved in cell wall biosynthesis
MRLIEGRTRADFLKRVSLVSSLSLLVLQLVVIGLTTIDAFSLLDWLYLSAAAQTAFALVLLLSALRNLRTTRPKLPATHYADRDLPTLTVAIPARNETDDLEACLVSLTQSNYPKLEIIVLDDCSQNRRTPEIMRQFAHDGVRYLSGKVPPDEWLAKNYAYYQLEQEANGELLLFCGVDARFESQTLRLLVETLLAKKKTMLSVIPANVVPTRWSLESLMVQPGRYAWELSLPRRLLNRPPVLSTCWLINTKALALAGGLPAVRRKNSVESYFARQTAIGSDGYAFIQSTPEIGLLSKKSFNEQRMTAVRTRYPQLHRRPELVGLLSLTELFIVSGPFVLALHGLIERQWILLGMSLVNVVLLNVFFSKVVNLTYRRFLLRGCWLLPFVILYDIVLLNYSMWQYEFGEIIWKGRNVCLPVMRAIPQLPKVD